MIEQIKEKILAIIENHRKLQNNVKSFNHDLAMGLQALIDEDMEILSIIESLQNVQTSRLWHDSNKEQPKQGSDVVIVNGRTGSILSNIVEVSPNRIWAYLDDLLKLEEISPKLPLISSKEELKQKPFKVEKGKWYVCIKDYHDKNCTFTKGKNYKSDKDGFIIDDEDKDTFERKIWEEDACEFFRPIKCLYTKVHYTDEDRKVLCDGCDEDCQYNQKKDIANKEIEEELHRFVMEYGPVATLQKCAYHFANWQKQKLLLNNEEYQTIPVVSLNRLYANEKKLEHLLENAIEGYWIARDKNVLRPLNLYEEKPEREHLNDGRQFWKGVFHDSICLPSILFTELKWEDEPQKVKLIIIKDD